MKCSWRRLGTGLLRLGWFLSSNERQKYQVSPAKNNCHPRPDPAVIPGPTRDP